MGEIYSWIKNIAFYLIFILAVQNILSNNKYKKLIKSFSGMILILIIILPVSNLLGFTEKISTLYEHKAIEMEIEEMQGNLSLMESSVYSAAMSQYNEYIKNQVGEFVAKEGLNLVEFECVISDEGDQVELENIRMTLSDQDKENSDIQQSDTTIYSVDESGNNIPFVIKELAPQIQGVVIIIEGGGNAVIVKKVTDVAEALLNVSLNRISVMKMKN